MINKVAFTLFAGALAVSTCASAGKNHGIEIPAVVSLNAIPVCYDFGCKNSSTVNLPLTEWQEVTGWFLPIAETPREERKQIAQAIGWMEVLIGRHTPTHRDIAFDLPPDPSAIEGLFPGQQDCIDESVNTTIYLKLLESNGMLKHHTVIDEAYRKAIFDQHWAGQIMENSSGTRYVVDSWFQPNGYLPVIQASEDWENISPLTAVVDHSSREDGSQEKDE